MNFLKRLTDKLMGKKKLGRPKKSLVMEPLSAELKEILPEKIEVNHLPKEKFENAHNWKYTDDEKNILIKLIAEGLTPEQVSIEMKERYQVEITPTLVGYYRYAKKWKPRIEKLRQEHLARIDLIDASHKSVRVKRMDWVQDKAIRNGDLKTAIAANDQMRKEFERDKNGDVNIFWNNPVYQQLNTLSDAELKRRYDEATKKLTQQGVIENGSHRTSEKD